MKRFLQTLLLLVAATLSSCYHSIHDFASPSPEAGTDVGYLAASLDYEFPEDIGTPMQNLNISVLGNGTEITSNFSSMEQAVEWLQQLPVGEYDVLVTQDMTSSHGYDLRQGVVQLHDATSSPDQSWYAMAHVTVRSNEITIAEFKLQRLLATLELNVSHVPEGTDIDVTVDHMASSVDLMKDDDGGRLGRPSDDYIAVPLTMASGSSATRTVSLTSGMHSLLPTSAAYDRTDLSISITTAEGKELFCIGDTPRMESGHTYIIDLDYTKLQPYMYFEWYRINDWVEGAVINGQVEIPEEEK